MSAKQQKTRALIKLLGFLIFSLLSMPLFSMDKLLCDFTPLATTTETQARTFGRTYNSNNLPQSVRSTLPSYQILKTQLHAKGLTLETAKTSEADAILKFINSVRAEYGLEVKTPISIVGSVDHDMYLFKPTYQRAKAEFLVVKDQNGEIIATVAIAEVNEERAELRKFYISPKLRGQGYGKLMLTYAIERAKAMGYATMELETHSSMHEGIRLYETFGFVAAQNGTHAGLNRSFVKPLR